MAEQIEEKLNDDQVRAEHERLGKEEVTALNELEAIVLVKSSLYGECRIISYTEASSVTWLEYSINTLKCLANGAEYMESRGVICPEWIK